MLYTLFIYYRTLDLMTEFSEFKTSYSKTDEMLFFIIEFDLSSEILISSLSKFWNDLAKFTPKLISIIYEYMFSYESPHNDCYDNITGEVFAMVIFGNFYNGVDSVILLSFTYFII